MANATPKLDFKTVLLTGGAGFIGSHLAEALIAEGKEVVVIDNFDPYYSPKCKRQNIVPLFASKSFHLIEGDICNPELLERVFKKWRMEVILHLAAKAGVRNSLLDAIGYHQVNVNGTLFLLEQARKWGVPHFLLASSSSIYGDDAPVPFREDAPGDRPISPYASSKRAAELAAFTYHHLYRIPITVLRFFTVYGPRQRPEMAIHQFARHLQKGEEIKLYGDGSSARDYTFISDIVAGVLSAAEKPFGYQIFNLGNSHMITLGELIAAMEEALGKKAKITFASKQPGDVERTCANISRAKEWLGFNPRVPLREGLSLFVQWLKEAPSSKKKQPLFARRLNFLDSTG